MLYLSSHGGKPKPLTWQQPIRLGAACGGHGRAGDALAQSHAVMRVEPWSEIMQLCGEEPCYRSSHQKPNAMGLPQARRHRILSRNALGAQRHVSAAQSHLFAALHSFMSLIPLSITSSTPFSISHPTRSPKISVQYSRRH